MDPWGYIVVALLGTGGAGTWLGHWARTKRAGVFANQKDRADDRADARALVQELRGMLQDERKTVQDQMAALFDERRGHLDCMARVGALEVHVGKIEAEHGECPQRIRELEAQIVSLRGEMLSYYSGGP